MRRRCDVFAAMNNIIPPSEEEVREAARAVRNGVCQRHQARLQASGFLMRLIIWFQIKREVRKELKRRFGLHLLRLLC